MDCLQRWLLINNYILFFSYIIFIPQQGSPFISSLDCGLTLTSHIVTHGPHVKTSYSLHFYFRDPVFCVKKSKISCMGNDGKKPCGMRDHKKRRPWGRTKLLQSETCTKPHQLNEYVKSYWMIQQQLTIKAEIHGVRRMSHTAFCLFCVWWVSRRAEIFSFSWPLWPWVL